MSNKMLTQSQIDEKLAEMRGCGFFNKKETKMIEKKCERFIQEMNNGFGYNDGEPLDQDGINFVLEYLKVNWMLVNGVVSEE